MTLAFNHRLHNALKRQAPDGYDVFAVKRQGTLLTVISCQDSDYFAPWTDLRSILESFGY